MRVGRRMDFLLPVIARVVQRRNRLTNCAVIGLIGNARSSGTYGIDVIRAGGIAPMILRVSKEK